MSQQPMSQQPTAASPRHRAATALAAVVATLAALLGLGTAPASAATNAYATVCFQHPNGSPYTYDQVAQRWTTGGWVNAGTARSVNGCVRWTVAGGQYWRFQAFYRVGSSYFQGTSNWYWVYGGSNVSFGTYYVYQYGY